MELIEYTNDLTSGVQDHLEEARKERDRPEMTEVVMKEAKGGENRRGEEEQQEIEYDEAEGGDEFKDAKETGFITSNTSNTQ